MTNKINLNKYSYTSFIAIWTGIALLLLSLLVFFLPEGDQPALTAPIVCVSVIFSIAWCWPLARNRSDGKVDLFHPSILFLMIYFAYFIFSGVWLWLYHNYESIWINMGSRPAFIVNSIFSLGAVSIFTFGLGMRIKPVSFRNLVRESLNQITVFSKKELRYLILIFLIIGGIIKFYHLSLLGPLTINILRFLSPSANYNLGINLSLFFVMLESMLDWAVLLAIFYYFMRYKETNKKNGFWFLLVFVVIIALFDYIVSAKRSGIIPFILLPLIWFHYLIKRISLRRAGMFFSVAMVLISGLLIGRTVLPLIAQNLDPTKYIGNYPAKIFAYFIDSGEWSTFDMITASVIQRDALLYQAGGPIIGFLKYSISTLIFIVPRVLWPGKPGYEDLSHIYFRVLVNPYDVAGIAPTIWGSSFLIFHLPGLIIAMFVLGWLFKSMYALFQPQKSKPKDVLLYSVFYWMAFQLVRFGTTGFVILMFVTSMFWGVLAAFLIWRRRPKKIIQFG